MLYAWARIATGSIWPGLIAHACLDYALITAFGGHFGISSFTFDAFTTTIGIVTGGWVWLLMHQSALLRANNAYVRS
jgi:membrane protease YdiL (CAAX protease family)